jgi:hypothetical protein
MICRRRTHKTAKVAGEESRSFDPAVSEWGNPSVRNGRDPSIYTRGVTRGTETSKYPEEKKPNEIPLVSGERKGNSPNQRFISGVVGRDITVIRR